MCLWADAAFGFTFRASSPGPEIFRVEVTSAKERDALPDRVNVPGGDYRLLYDSRTGFFNILKQQRFKKSSAWQGRLYVEEGQDGPASRQISLHWTACEGEYLYGLGERFDGLAVQGKVVRMYNEAVADQPQASSPWCTPVLFSSQGYALFWEGHPEGVFNLIPDRQGTYSFRQSGSRMVFYLVMAPSIQELIQKRYTLVHKPKALPAWSLAPWVGGTGFSTQEEAARALQVFCNSGYPVGAAVLAGWKGPAGAGKAYEFDADRWPDPSGWFRQAAACGVKTVLWQAPLIHKDSSQFASAQKQGFLVRGEDGGASLRDGWIPGFAHIDFSAPGAGRWWAQLAGSSLSDGLGGMKLDGALSIKPDDRFADGIHGRQRRNGYANEVNASAGELVADKLKEGLLVVRSGGPVKDCPVVMWSGDHHATWKAFRRQISAGLSAGVSGMPFWFSDIGGTLGVVSDELYIRWAQFAALSPIMAYGGYNARDPWLIGGKGEKAYRRLAGVRMNLRPYLRALGGEAERSGIPVMRPMIFEFPYDARFLAEDSQYMLGSQLLIAPVYSQGRVGRVVKIPYGTWQHMDQPVAYRGPMELEVPFPLEGTPVLVKENEGFPCELAEGDPFGKWSEGVRVRNVMYDTSRPLVYNLKADLHPDPLGAGAQLDFLGRDGELEIHIARNGGLTGVEPVRGGSRYLVTIPPPSGPVTLPLEEEVVVTGGEGEVRFPVRWDVGVDMDVSEALMDEGVEQLSIKLECSGARSVPIRLVVEKDGVVEHTLLDAQLLPGEVRVATMPFDRSKEAGRGAAIVCRSRQFELARCPL